MASAELSGCCGVGAFPGCLRVSCQSSALKRSSAQALLIMRAPPKGLHLGWNDGTTGGGEQDERDFSDSHPHPPSGFNFSPNGKGGAFRWRRDNHGVSAQTQSKIGGIPEMGLKKV